MMVVAVGERVNEELEVIADGQEAGFGDHDASRSAGVDVAGDFVVRRCGRVARDEATRRLRSSKGDVVLFSGPDGGIFSDLTVRSAGPPPISWSESS
jgi:hypothetical protein